jgi:hypothetical protein
MTMNKITKAAAVLSSSILILSSAFAVPNDAAEPTQNTSPGAGTKAETAVKHGAKATGREVKHVVKPTARVVKRGEKAATKGVKRRAKTVVNGVKHGTHATGKTSDRTNKKPVTSPASSAQTGE